MGNGLCIMFLKSSLPNLSGENLLWLFCLKVGLKDRTRLLVSIIFGSHSTIISFRISHPAIAEALKNICSQT